MTMTVFDDLLLNMIDSQLNELYNINEDNKVHVDIIRIAIRTAIDTSNKYVKGIRYEK